MLLSLINKIRDVRKTMEMSIDISNAIDTLHSRIDISDAFYTKFHQDKKSQEYQNVFDKQNPLVSICICTFNRGELLVDRCIKSVLRQDYKNIEIVVVGDRCTDDTEHLIKKIKDSRLHFHNLAKRGDYPLDPSLRWMVAGTAPINESLKMATGDFITHLDDDDEYAADRIAKLVHFICEQKSDFIWHPFWFQLASGRWRLNQAPSLIKGSVTTSSSFYHRWFFQIPWDINAYRYNEPGDWNRFRKIKYLGAKIARFPEPLLRHYRERNQSTQNGARR